MNSDDRILLERSELLRNVDVEIFDCLLNDCLLYTVNNGEKLLDIGQKNNSLYLILEGELHVYLNSRDLSEHAVLSSGQCVGEMSLIDGGAASALVVAAKDTRVLLVPHDYVWSLVENSNGIARNLLSILSGRIRNDNLMRVTTNDSSLVFEIARNVDTLTGLHNRNWMDESFPRMMLRCERNKLPVCLLLTDIDDFKIFCHSHGPTAGDNVLKILAKILAENLRPQDLLVFVGADKFAVLLPETDIEVAARIAERLREEVEESSLSAAANELLPPSKAQLLTEDSHITISLGIAQMNVGESLDSLFSHTHLALYQAKASGRNRVKLAVSPS